MTRIITASFTFEVEGNPTEAELDTLAGHAYVQFDDPHDNDGERVTHFTTRMIATEWKEDQS